ncbi:MAG: hypothetical protein J2P37_30120, partial [Ktedonobacteraceae bacterium]|nr:hypothetical protein [Ktedonobacteraceae bacterium]
MEEQLSPTCTFALSVLMEHAQDANAVPEEALEAARQHIATCEHCAQAAQSVEVASDAPRKKRKARRATRAGSKDAAQSRATNAPTASEQVAVATAEKLGAINCQQCRVLLPEYAVALVSKQNVAQLYPEVQAHLALCDTGCLALLEKLTSQDVLQEPREQATQPRNPFSAILVGFWRGGPVTLSGRVLSYGMLILLLVAGSLGVYLGYSWHARYRESSAQIDPDGAGLSDGLKVFDACNGAAFQSKLAAARALREKEIARAQSLYDDALRTVQADTTGCNGAEAAIYRQNLSIRQSGRPYGIVIVAFDSGPSSNVDRHTRYAAYTQELIGISIGQQQYNAVQEKTAGAPLLYIVLANTAGSEAGAEQLSRAISTMAKGASGQVPGLLFNGPHPLLGVLGSGPGNLTQIMLPTMCRDGVPLIAPTAMERFISDQLTQVSFYRHCAPGFAFMRFSPDTVAQGNYGATYAYDILKVHDAAIFYNPDNPASGEAAQSFANSFSHLSKASIVARETVITSQLVDSQGEGQHAV